MNGKRILSWIIASGVIIALISFIQLLAILINEPFLILEMMVGLAIFTVVQYFILSRIDKDGEQMGWCSGTSIFDGIAEFVIENGIDEQDSVNLLVRLIDALENEDWDCQQDSHYYNNPIVQKAFEALHPDWFEDKNEVADG